jgi:hypothetical protein
MGVITTVQIELLEYPRKLSGGKIEKYADSVDKNYITNNHLH